MLRAWEGSEAAHGLGANSGADFAEAHNTIQLMTNLARSREGLVDITEGNSPVLVVELQDPAKIFDQVVCPFLSLRSRRRPGVKVHTGSWLSSWTLRPGPGSPKGRSPGRSMVTRATTRGPGIRKHVARTAPGPAQ
jgi:hypothetical protein